MKRISAKAMVIAVASSAIILVLAGAAIIQGAVPPANPAEQLDEFISSPQGFYGLPDEQTAFLKGIVLGDKVINTMIESTVYDYRLDVGCRLVTDMNPRAFSTWMEGGRTDTNVISAYAGVLYFGYNQMYTFDIDASKSAVVNLVDRSNKGQQIPEITRQEKQDAIQMALNDPTLKAALEGKQYILSPENVGVWHATDAQGNFIKLGASLTIYFEKPVQFIGALPNILSDTLVDIELYRTELIQYNQIVTGFHLLLDNGRQAVTVVTVF